jgi:hypothetical protein
MLFRHTVILVIMIAMAGNFYMMLCLYLQESPQILCDEVS